MFTKRYLAYCYSNWVENPEDMIKQDKIKYPGGSMCNFMIWARQQLSDWKTETGCVTSVPCSSEYRDFDKWLLIKFPNLLHKKDVK